MSIPLLLTEASTAPDELGGWQLHKIWLRNLIARGVISLLLDSVDLLLLSSNLCLLSFEYRVQPERARFLCKVFNLKAHFFYFERRHSSLGYSQLRGEVLGAITELFGNSFGHQPLVRFSWF